MSLAISDVEPIRSARRAPVGADSPELVAHLGMRACGPVAVIESHGGETCAAHSARPSGGAEIASGAVEEPTPRVVWSRQDWKSTAAFTIGRPPRAPLAG